MIGEKEWFAAEERGTLVEREGLVAVSAAYDVQSHTMRVTLKRGFTISFAKERSEVMADAKDTDLADVEIQGAGRYVIFPKLDDGFTVDGMLAGRFGSEGWEKAWAAKHLHAAA